MGMLGFSTAQREALLIIAAQAAVALVLARVMSSMIYNVSPADPFTYVSVVTIVVATALLACYLPARRAAKANPMVALRAD